MSYSKKTYSYKCDECNTEIVKNSLYFSCSHCHINLCNKCHGKRDKHLCAWCYKKVPDDIIWKKKFSKFLMIFVPIILLLIPIPVPAILLFGAPAENLTMFIFLLIFIMMSFFIFGFMQIHYSNEMNKSISSERGEDSKNLSNKKEEIADQTSNDRITPEVTPEVTLEATPINQGMNKKGLQSYSEEKKVGEFTENSQIDDGKMEIEIGKTGNLEKTQYCENCGTKIKIHPSNRCLNCRSLILT